MKLADQNAVQENGALAVVTECVSDQNDLSTRHYLEWKADEPVFATWAEIRNRGASPVSLEMITSFNLGHLTPFDECDAPGRLFVHRLRSSWASEGRHEVRSIEELELERSWAGHGIKRERLSWQMEVFRQDDLLAFSGGLADRELGHWLKNLPPGDSFTTPKAFLSTSDEGFDMLCSRLTTIQHKNADAQWYANDDGHWDCAQGDWQPSSRLFPDGLEATCAEIRKMGVVPGLWFEFEVAGKQSRLWGSASTTRNR